MAAMLGRTDVAVKKISKPCTVPNNPKAKLMYYLDVMCSVLDLSDTENLSRLRNYRNYNSLSESEIDTLVALCLFLSPDVLIGKVIFQDDALCGDRINALYEISAVSRNLLVSDSIVIGGQRRSVSKVMFFKQRWMVLYWIDPMKYFTPRLQRIARSARSRQSRRSCCVII